MSETFFEMSGGLPTSYLAAPLAAGATSLMLTLTTDARDAFGTYAPTVQIGSETFALSRTGGRSSWPTKHINAAVSPSDTTLAVDGTADFIVNPALGITHRVGLAVRDVAEDGPSTRVEEMDVTDIIDATTVAVTRTAPGWAQLRANLNDYARHNVFAITSAPPTASYPIFQAVSALFSPDHFLRNLDYQEDLDVFGTLDLRVRHEVTDMPFPSQRVPGTAHRSDGRIYVFQWPLRADSYLYLTYAGTRPETFRFEAYVSRITDAAGVPTAGPYWGVKGNLTTPATVGETKTMSGVIEYWAEAGFSVVTGGTEVKIANPGWYYVEVFLERAS